MEKTQPKSAALTAILEKVMLYNQNTKGSITG